MLTELPADHPRVVVLRAAGRAFCGGVDIKVWVLEGRRV